MVRTDFLPAAGSPGGLCGYPGHVTEYVDVTVPLVPGLVPLYPGDTDLVVRRQQHRAQGDPANVSSLTCLLHCGTHVDAPVHFFDGQPGVDSVPIETLVGPAWVADATGVDGDIDSAALRHVDIPDGATRILFKTSNSALWNAPKFVEQFVAVALDAASELAQRGVRLVGIDLLSIASYQDPAPTHEAFLRAGVTILETVDLRAVEPGWWTLTCLPLRIPGADGAPARAVLSRLPSPRARPREGRHRVVLRQIPAIRPGGGRPRAPPGSGRSARCWSDPHPRRSRVRRCRPSDTDMNPHGLSPMGFMSVLVSARRPIALRGGGLC